MKKTLPVYSFIIFLSMFLMIVNYSCKKDSTDESDNGSGIPETEKCHILRLTAGYVDFKFRYNDQFQLKKITAWETGYTVYAEVQHDSNGDIIRIEYFDDSYSMTGYQEFEYMDDKVIKGYEKSNNEYELLYSYNDAGLLESISITQISMKSDDLKINNLIGGLIGYEYYNLCKQKNIETSADSKASAIILFQWNANNLIKETWKSTGGAILFSYEHTSYDNERNPFKDIRYPVRIVGGPWALTISTNNFTQVTYTSSTGGIETTPVSYSYNNLGYPLTMTFLSGGHYTLDYLCTNCTPLPTVADAGPDQINLPDPSTNMEGNTPQIGTGTWSIIYGNGGTIQDVHDPNSSFTSNSDSALFVLQWEISNECGTTRDDVIISFKPPGGLPCPGLPEFTYEGETYHTVLVDNQCWMRENLNVGQMINGDQQQNDNMTIEKYCYDNDIQNCNKYGGLYQWNELMSYDTNSGTQGICPPGWHIPTNDEWNILVNNIGGEFLAGGKLKEPGTSNWDPPNSGANNETGFTALPGGIRKTDFSFVYLREYGGFWTSTQFDLNDAYRWYLAFDYEGIYSGNNNKDNGRSVRCIKN